MSPLLLLSLLFITASGSTFLSYRSNYLKANRVAPLAYNTTEFIAKSFIEKLNEVIASRDRDQVSALFGDNIRYLGCWKNHTNREVIDLFLSDAKLSIVETSFRQELSSIWIGTIVYGYGSKPFQASLRIARKGRRYVFVEGRTNTCPDRGSPTPSPVHDPQVVVHKFLGDSHVSQ